MLHNKIFNPNLFLSSIKEFQGVLHKKLHVPASSIALGYWNFDHGQATWPAYNGTSIQAGRTKLNMRKAFRVRLIPKIPFYVSFITIHYVAFSYYLNYCKYTDFQMDNKFNLIKYRPFETQNFMAFWLSIHRSAFTCHQNLRAPLWADISCN